MVLTVPHDDAATGGHTFEQNLLFNNVMETGATTPLDDSTSMLI